MEIKTLALILLIGRVVSVFFTVLILRRQVGLFKIPLRSEVERARWLYFGLGSAAFAFNIIPIAIDILTLTSDVTRNSNTVNPIGVLYALNACLASITLAIFIWLLYRQAARLVILVDQDKYDALQKK